jgi:hypothetical protein|nr:TraX family protein [uncultured Pseudomonas sp.]
MAETLTTTAPVKRNHGLDLVKWIALITMVLDHLRLVWPELGLTFILGRVSFPFFCLAIASNVARGVPGRLMTLTNGRYFAYLVFFSMISEVPYRYFSDSNTLNVFPTLTLGLLIALGMYQRKLSGVCLSLAALVVAGVFEESIMYGVYGALLPAAFMLAIKRPGLPILALLPAIICVLMNSRFGALERALTLDAFAALALIAAFSSALFGLWLTRCRLTVDIWRVQHWAYWFYPVHLVVLQLIRTCI